MPGGRRPGIEGVPGRGAGTLAADPERNPSALAAAPNPGAGALAAAPDREVVHADHILRIVRDSAPLGRRVRFLGEIDASNASAVAEVLAEVTGGVMGGVMAGARGDAGPLTLDLSGLTFVDVAGVRALIRLCRGGWIQMENVPPHMLRLLELIPAASRP
ncbi:anti-anti-sigma regulatory factor [Thermocatellispora tengchongensis]|uniref:Anti-anti-sigma regulatory factor n=1 Tax=Thermocatellispora tengchongensis TaxID=1073253 RepID=A0A840P9D3_9ACTN|nr:STAS domain-containing protein [Thermocatellispora tengchongensis]MBB5134523.1 anti-anti-sigma regulatory factor [Thermocatellispora tengchongensis]